MGGSESEACGALQALHIGKRPEILARYLVHFRVGWSRVGSCSASPAFLDLRAEPGDRVGPHFRDAGSDPTLKRTAAWAARELSASATLTGLDRLAYYPPRQGATSGNRAQKWLDATPVARIG